MKRKKQPERYQKLVFQGFREAGRIICWHKLINGKLSGKTLVYKPSRGSRSLLVGGTYRAKMNGNGIYYGTLEFVSDDFLRANKKEVLKWETQSEMELMKRAARKKEREAKLCSALKTALEPIKELYWETDPLGRKAIEVMVLAAIRS